MWMPTRPANGEGCTDREETRAGTRNSPTNEHLIQSTGVMSTACREGDLRSVREARDWLGVAAPNVVFVDRLYQPELPVDSADTIIIGSVSKVQPYL